MSEPGDCIAKAALALVGVPFRLHGRDPETGLDCVGLVASALASAGDPVRTPQHYALRNRETDTLLRFAAEAGLAPVSGRLEPGDVLLVSPGPWQLHLLVAGFNDQLVHAHAGLRRVVAMPGPSPWPLAAHWRWQTKG